MIIYPKHISICIPVWNGASHLEACFESIKAQSYTDFEVVISDGGSSDNSLEMIERFKAQSGIQVKVLRQSNVNMATNWDACISAAQGVFIKFLFQDDQLLPHSMEQFAKAGEHAEFVYCNRSFHFPNHNPEDFQGWIKRYGNLHRYWKNPPESYTSGLEFIRNSKELFSYPLNKIGEPSATFIRKSALKKAGTFNSELRQFTDLEMYYRLMMHTKIAYIDEELINIGLHQQQATQNNLVQNKAKEDLQLHQQLQKALKKEWHRSNQSFPFKYKLRESVKKLMGRS